MTLLKFASPWQKTSLLCPTFICASSCSNTPVLPVIYFVELTINMLLSAFCCCRDKSSNNCEIVCSIANWGMTIGSLRLFLPYSVLHSLGFQQRVNDDTSPAKITSTASFSSSLILQCCNSSPGINSVISHSPSP